MFKKTLLTKTATIWGITSLITLLIWNFPVLSQDQKSSDNQSDSLADVTPDRRRGGASRRIQNTQERTNKNETVEAPQRRKPAAGRPNDNYCDFDPQKLTALIPRNLVSTTVNPQPTLLFFIPGIAKGTDLELVLRSPNDELIYKKEFQSKGQRGIMNLQLPPLISVSPQVNATPYHWYLSVICNHSDRAYDIVVEGLIKPVSLNPTLAEKIAQATPTEQIKLYQDYNLWNETLNLLVSLKRSRPQDPTVIGLWEKLLESVDLDQTIAQQPLLNP